MKQAILIDFPQNREKRKVNRTRDCVNVGKSGRVYNRGGKLWADFHYLGERIREPSGLRNSPANLRLLRQKLDLIVAEIENGIFEFAKRFPHSNKKARFSELEGRIFTKGPEDVRFGDYLKNDTGHDGKPDT